MCSTASSADSGAYTPVHNLKCAFRSLPGLGAALTSSFGKILSTFTYISSGMNAYAASGILRFLLDDSLLCVPKSFRLRGPPDLYSLGLYLPLRLLLVV